MKQSKKIILLGLAATMLTLLGCTTTYWQDGAGNFIDPTPTHRAGVTVQVGESSYYGPLDVYGYPQPQLMYDQPMTVYQVSQDRAPIYLRVPREHANNWSNYCGQYNACNERVYFVDDNWYNREYVPRYRVQPRVRQNTDGVFVRVGEPGYYGRIDIVGYPQPQLMYDQPMTVYQVSQDRAPIYLRVPRDHASNWRNYCGQYNACNERVYFVDDNWYTREYVPRYRVQPRGPQ